MSNNLTDGAILSDVSDLVIDEDQVLEPNSVLKMLDSLDNRLSSINFDMNSNYDEICTVLGRIIRLFGGRTHGETPYGDDYGDLLDN